MDKITKENIVALDYNYIDTKAYGSRFMNNKHNNIELFLDLDNITINGFKLLIVDKYLSRIKYDGLVNNLDELEKLLKKYTKLKYNFITYEKI